MAVASEPPNTGIVAVTRVTRSSARKTNAEASRIDGAPLLSPHANCEGKKRPSDDVNANGEVDGGANLPPAKRRKVLPLKRGGA
jgi:hypothetical protein